MHLSGVNQTPTIPEAIGILAVDPKPTLRLPLNGRHGIGAAFKQQVDRLAPGLCSVKSIE